MFVGHDEKRERMEIMELRGLLNTNVLYMLTYVYVQIHTVLCVHACIRTCVHLYSTYIHMYTYIHIKFCLCMYGEHRERMYGIHSFNT